MTTIAHDKANGWTASPAWLRRVDRVLNAVDTALLIVVMILLAFLTLIIGLLVLDRTLQLPFSTGWVTEISNYVMAYCAFLPASWILKERGHVALDLLYERLPGRGQTVVIWIGGTIAIATCTMLSYFAWGVVIDSYQRDLLLRGAITMPRYLVFLPVAVGLSMLAIRLMRDLAALVTGEKPASQTNLEEV